MSFPVPHHIQDLDNALTDSRWDAVILISDQTQDVRHPLFGQVINSHAAIDERVHSQALLMGGSDLPGGRLVFAPTKPLNRDYDDVRRIADAASDATTIAIGAGIKNPLLVVELAHASDRYLHALEVAYLAMCQTQWQPLEARQALLEADIEPLQNVGLVSSDAVDLEWLSAAEAGRRVARDLCGTEPERMAPPGFARYCEEAFEGSAVKVTVLDNDQQILTQYPLLHAVARASVEVERHQPRVIRLEYQPQGEITDTLYFAGKGITFDTGGADLKVGGHMAGMSRDKGGAAAVAGFMKVLAELKPVGLKVVAEIGAVRNSIGAEAFVPDEIITGHAGVRVRVGNTDAEGRMVLADLLSHLREEASESVNPQLFSVATLTGHAAIAFGPYTALVENGPARLMNTAHTLVEAGDQWGDPAEQSRSRREDFDFIKGRTKADDVLSSNNAPSVGTPRGHQFPMAFLSVASGLEQHGNDSQSPMPYTHIDIAGSGVEGGDWQHGKPTAAPVMALAARYLLPRR